MNWHKYQETLRLEESGKMEAALSELKKLIGTSEDAVENYLIFIGIASCLGRLHQYVQAREYIGNSYAVLGKNNPYYPSAMFMDASIEEQAGNCERSLAILDSIIEQYPEVLTAPDYEDLKIKVLSMRGIVLTGLERYKEARPLLELAVDKDFGKKRTLFYLGLCCYYLGDLPNVQRYMREALALDLNPQYALSTHYYLAMAYLWQEKNAWAGQEFEWCLLHIEAGGVRRDYVINGLVRTSEALGQKDDAQRYSKMLAD